MEIVPFEIAKKLKEKGFREKCFAFYYKQGGFQWNCMRADTGLVNVSWACFNYNDIVNGDKINAPPISQVLKWLREEKKIFIQIEINGNGYISSIYGRKYFDSYLMYSLKNNFKTYELAALAGVEYVVDNLI